MVDGLASTFRAIHGAPTIPAPAAPAASLRKPRRPVLTFAGFAMAGPLVSDGNCVILLLRWANRQDRACVRKNRAFGRRGLLSRASDRLLYEVVGEDQRGHRLSFRNPRYDRHVPARGPRYAPQVE